jgi:hypothetical protein
MTLRGFGRSQFRRRYSFSKLFHRKKRVHKPLKVFLYVVDVRGISGVKRSAVDDSPSRERSVKESSSKGTDGNHGGARRRIEEAGMSDVRGNVGIGMPRKKLSFLQDSDRYSVVTRIATRFLRLSVWSHGHQDQSHPLGLSYPDWNERLTEKVCDCKLTVIKVIDRTPRF